MLALELRHSARYHRCDGSWHSLTECHHVSILLSNPYIRKASMEGNGASARRLSSRAQASDSVKPTI